MPHQQQGGQMQIFPQQSPQQHGQMQMFPQRQQNRQSQMLPQQQRGQMQSPQQRNGQMQMFPQQQRGQTQGSQQQNGQTQMFPQQQNGQMQMFPQQQRGQTQGSQQQNGQAQMFPQQQGQMQNPQQQSGQMQIPQQQTPTAIDPVIKFEPLDESLLRQVQIANPELNLEHNAVPPLISPPHEPSPIRHDADVTGKLSQFIQNERNAGIYYKNLADNSPNQYLASKLAKVSENTKKHSDLYNEIYKSYTTTSLEIKDEKISTDITFPEGIRLAITEENDSLNQLNEIYDLIHDEKNLKLLNSMLYKKLGLLSNLHAINTTLKQN